MPGAEPFPALTEAGWDSCVDPERMVPTLVEPRSERKLRLLACALVRYAPFDREGNTIWDLLPSFSWSNSFTSAGDPIDCRDVVLAAESRADGEPTAQSWEAITDMARYAPWAAEADTFGYDPQRLRGSNFRYAAASAVEHTVGDQREKLAEFMFHYRWYLTTRFNANSSDELNSLNGLRACELTDDIFGNPFRPAVYRRRWENGEVLGLASAMYRARDFGRMTELGRALKSAGCRDEQILAHCFQGTVHARGCWLIDHILGKS